MAGSALITNPGGAYSTVSSYVTGEDANGSPLQAGAGEVYSLRANAAVTKGQALMFVDPTAAVPDSVTPMTSAGASHIFAGIAGNSAAAGNSVIVQRRGFAVALVDGTVAAGNFLLSPATTTGTCTGSATAGAAGKVLGRCRGVAANGRAAVFLDPVTFPQTA